MADVLKEGLIEGEERSSEQVRTRPIRAITLVGVLLCVLALPALYRTSESGKLPFDAHYLTELNRIEPDYVWIGNSMLGTRIDQAVLTQKLGENCCYVMATAGAESAWQHQALKNHILAAERRPKKVFVFFRDTYLTRPSYRAQDMYWWRIERLSHAQEPELDKAMQASRTWQESLEYRLGRVYPLQKRRPLATSAVERIAAGHAPWGHETPGSKFNQLFALDKMRQMESDDTAFDNLDKSHFDFASKVETSLLPSMIKLANDAGVQLVFVRVQRRPTRTEPAELKTYLAQLEDYVTFKGAGFYDFTGDPELTLDHYLDGDHIRPEWRRESTDHFVRRMQPFLQSQTSSDHRPSE
jgi:hypothetical protein